MLHGWGSYRWSIYLIQNRREVLYASSFNLTCPTDLMSFLYLSVTLAGAVLFILFGFIYIYEFFVDISAVPSP